MNLTKKYDDSLIKDEASWLDRLHNEAQKRPGKELDFEEEDEHLLERQALSVTSDVSARIFTTLEKEGIVKPEKLIRRISSLRLSDGWITFIKNFLNRPDITKDDRRLAILELYKAGIDREKLRPELLQMVSKQQDTVALELMLFRVELNTGRVLADVSSANLKLYKELAKPEVQPELQMTCAQFATEIKDYATSQRICGDLLGRRYKGLSNPLALAPEQDLQLSRSRNSALQLMFYKLKNEWAFSNIYARSELNKELVPAELAPKDKQGKPEASFRSYALGEMEAEYAESLVDQVKKWRNNDAKN